MRKQTRLRPFAFMTWAVLVAALSLAAHADTRAAKPNVVLFLADDAGYGDLASHGNPHVKTPHLDTFARDAVEFTGFHVSPVCSPTRASLMTGRYNFRTGVCDVFGKGCQMDPGEVTVAEALRAAGYATGIFGKWHLGDDPARNPRAQGFDESLVHAGASMRKYFDPELIQNGEKKLFQGYCMDLFTDAAMSFVERNRARPFLLYLPANLIHVPLQVSDELAAPYSAPAFAHGQWLPAGQVLKKHERLSVPLETFDWRVETT